MAIHIKRNNTAYANALHKEAEGLAMLKDHLAGTGVRIPRVHYVSEEQLQMEAVERGPWTDGAWRTLAQGLAVLHRASRSAFGLERDNYIGLSPQLNGLRHSWGDFFVDQRLLMQIHRIRDGRLKHAFQKRVEDRRDRLTAFLDNHCAGPSLVHGDLWSGNVLCDREGTPWLIDPAVYFADREVDIAMTEMFGGFGEAFYQTCRRELPLDEAYPQKRAIYNLYHCLNHFNLFGDTYLNGCEAGLRAIERL